jgi:hypothetical protein
VNSLGRRNKIAPWRDTLPDTSVQGMSLPGALTGDENTEKDSCEAIYKLDTHGPRIEVENEKFKPVYKNIVWGSDERDKSAVASRFKAHGIAHHALTTLIIRAKARNEATHEYLCRATSTQRVQALWRAVANNYTEIALERAKRELEMVSEEAVNACDHPESAEPSCPVHDVGEVGAELSPWETASECDSLSLLDTENVHTMEDFERQQELLRSIPKGHLATMVVALTILFVHGSRIEDPDEIARLAVEERERRCALQTRNCLEAV